MVGGKQDLYMTSRLLVESIPLQSVELGVSPFESHQTVVVSFFEDGLSLSV